MPELTIIKQKVPKTGHENENEDEDFNEHGDAGSAQSDALLNEGEQKNAE